jgi:hypothetical protein
MLLPKDEGTLQGSRQLSKDEGNISPAKDEDNMRHAKNEGLPDHVVHHKVHHVSKKTEGAATKRKALLVGISYSGPSNKWSPLDGPHGDVDRIQELLLSA